MTGNEKLREYLQQYKPQEVVRQVKWTTTIIAEWNLQNKFRITSYNIQVYLHYLYNNILYVNYVCFNMFIYMLKNKIFVFEYVALTPTPARPRCPIPAAGRIGDRFYLGCGLSHAVICFDHKAAQDQIVVRYLRIGLVGAGWRRKERI